MESIVRVFVNILLMFLVIVALTGVALGDVPPPLPTVPGTDVAIPGPGLILIAGLCLAGAMTWAGSIARRNGNASGGARIKGGAVGVAVLAIFASLVSWTQFSDYVIRKSSWRSGGPVEKLHPKDLPGDRERPSQTEGIDDNNDVEAT